MAPPRQRLLVVDLVRAKAQQALFGFVRAETVDVRLQGSQRIGFAALCQREQPGSECGRRGLRAATAVTGFGHRTTTEQVARAAAAQEGVEPGVEQAHGKVLLERRRAEPARGAEGAGRQAWRMASTDGDQGCMRSRWLPPMHSGFIASRSG
ncbi:hypothetical protein D3C72_1450230 [compost metagenome]